LFFASIHGFAHLIYPLIPVERGGGRYSTGTVVDICMRPTGSAYLVWAVPPSVQTVQPGGYCTEGVIIQDAVLLEQEPDSLYVASVYDPGVGKPVTNQCGLNSWHEGINGPGVLALSVAGVIGVRDRDTVEHFCAGLGGQSERGAKCSGGGRWRSVKSRIRRRRPASATSDPAGLSSRSPRMVVGIVLSKARLI
jgi:hypothetical protein